MNGSVNISGKRKGHLTIGTLSGMSSRVVNKKPSTCTEISSTVHTLRLLITKTDSLSTTGKEICKRCRENNIKLCIISDENKGSPTKGMRGSVEGEN